MLFPKKEHCGTKLLRLSTYIYISVKGRLESQALL